MCLLAIYIFPGSVCLFCSRKICGPILGIYKSLTYTWMWKYDWGRAIPFLGLHNGILLQCKAWARHVLLSRPWVATFPMRVDPPVYSFPDLWSSVSSKVWQEQTGQQLCQHHRYRYLDRQGRACKGQPGNSIPRSIKGTQDWDFFGFVFEICIISLLVMWKY